MLKFLMETKSGRKGVKNFNDIYEYIDFMTKNGNKIKFIKESEMPYTDKPVELPSVSSSEGWEQIDASAFGDIDSDGEKGDCLLPSDTQSVFKDDVKFEPSKSSESTDKADEPKIENSPVKTNNDGEEQDMPKFNYEDSDSKEENKSNNKDEKKEDLKESSVGIDSNSRYVIEWNKSEGFRVVDKLKGKTVYSSPNRENALRYFKRKAKEEGLNEDNHLDDKSYVTQSYLGYNDIEPETWKKWFEDEVKKLGTKDGDREKVEYFRKKYEQSKQHQNSNLDEDFKSGLKKAGKFAKGALAGAVMAGSLANGANAMDNSNMYYDGARNPYIDSYNDNDKIMMINGQEYSLDELKKLQKEQGLSDEEMKEIIKGNNPYEDGARNPNTESEYEGEIAEALRLAGVQLDETCEENVNDEDDEDIDEKTGKKKLFEEEPLEEEIGPSRLWKYQEHPEMNFAILSADRSERTPEENKAKSEELKKDIKSMGYWYTELKGGYVEIGENGKRVPVDGEDSFIVPNMTKEEAMELGKKYDQDTVMFKDAKAHTLQYIITNERAGNVGDADSSFETQAGKDNFSVSSGDDLDYYSRLPKSNKKDLKIGFNWKE